MDKGIITGTKAFNSEFSHKAHPVHYLPHIYDGHHVSVPGCASAHYCSGASEGNRSVSKFI